MRILATVDYHGRLDAIDALTEVVTPAYDLVIIVGDLGHLTQAHVELSHLDPPVRERIEERLRETDVSPTDRATAVYDVLSESDIPVFAVPGNSDVEAVHDVMSHRGTDLHGTVIEHGGVSFAGFGGVPEMPVPVELPFEYTEDEIAAHLDPLMTDIDSPWVLVTHVPPHNTPLDLTTDGDHVGSTSVRQAIATGRPVLALCGHVHEARGIHHVGETTVVNPGPIMDGYVAEIVIAGDTAEATLLER